MKLRRDLIQQYEAAVQQFEAAAEKHMANHAVNKFGYKHKNGYPKHFSTSPQPPKGGRNKKSPS